MVLITYDVETSTEGGARRLRKVAKACMDYGMRVQNSVFECVLDQAQYVNLRVKILGIIDRERDSVRFYYQILRSYFIPCNTSCSRSLKN